MIDNENRPARNWDTVAPMGGWVRFLNEDGALQVTPETIGQVVWVADRGQAGRNVLLADGREVNTPVYELEDIATPERPVLTLHQARLLGILIDAALDGRRCRWALDGLGYVQTGTLRTVGDEHGCSLTSRDDIRDAFVRITSSSGFEYFRPVRAVLAMIDRGDFAID